jgi:phenylpropionate dioxygenase-like ring-hydroxylating dioxygenase large terminal subunit
MRREIHPLSGALYEEIEQGQVRVSKNDKIGIFTWEGRYVEGDITSADVHLLSYVGGPDVPPEFNVNHRAMRAPVADGEPSDAAKAAAAAYAGAVPIAASDGNPFAKYVGDPGRQTPSGTRSKAISFPELLDLDRFPERIPETLRTESPMPGGVRKLPTDRYWKQEFHDLEVERIWKHAWQMACHVDDIPDIGDYIVYDVAQLSFLVVRLGPNEFKAFYNSCLHRGRQLREFDGKRATEFRCPFHGWCWEIDGSLREITSEWDYPGMRDEVAQLPEVRSAVWGGFLFINPDAEAESFEAFMGELPTHLEKYHLERRYKQVHVAKIIRANWKLNQEAFIEGYHVIATHPQIMIYGGDGANHPYDVFGNWSRGVTVSARTSAQRDIHPAHEEIQTHRSALADANRGNLREIIGDEVDSYSDSELVDAPYNLLFPNFHPWGTFARICYRFRPYGNDPDMSIHEVMLLSPWPVDKPKPPPTQIHWLGPDDPWTDAPELGGPLGRILNQDSCNLPNIQRGMKAKRDPYVILGGYNEARIRHFHELYDRWMGLSEGKLPRD